MAAEKLRFDFSHKSAVSDTELEKVEEISTSYIRQNCPVFAQDVALVTARQIHGVRAVFGETYPDPVRVVSVGVPVTEILQNVTDERWAKVSVEFCGGTHVQKTGDIKELIVVEESGIAKGIRRIVAVTGEAAHAAQRVAADFAEHLARLDRMPNGPDKEVNVKRTQSDLNALVISCLSKSRLRARFAKIHKDVLDAQKSRQKAEIKAALDAVITSLADTDANGEEGKNKSGLKGYLVLRLPISSANTKAISEVLNYVKTNESDKMVYVFAVDDPTASSGGGGGGCGTGMTGTTNGITTTGAVSSQQNQTGRNRTLGEEEDGDERKVAHGCYVGTPSSSSSKVDDDNNNLRPEGSPDQAGHQKNPIKPIDAAEWGQLIAGIVGGKTGGKASTCQGIGRRVQRVDEAIVLAEKWIRERLSLS